MAYIPFNVHKYNVMDEQTIETSIRSDTWLSTDYKHDMQSEDSLTNLCRVESEREVSEITHDNTLHEQSTWNEYESLIKCDPFLIKEITETVEIDKKKSIQESNDCDHTRVTMVRDVRANITGIASTSDYRKQYAEKFQPRVDLETLYIVECDRKEPKTRVQQNGGLAARLNMSELLKLNSYLTRKEDDAKIVERSITITEEELSVRYELHEYQHTACLLMYVGEIDNYLNASFTQIQNSTLTKYENRSPHHLDVLVGDDMSNFILPQNSHKEIPADSKIVSVNYINSSSYQLIGCERRIFDSLSEPIKAALLEEKTKLGQNRYLSILVVSRNTGRNADKTGSISSHQILEKYIPLIQKLRYNIHFEPSNGVGKKTSKIWAYSKYNEDDPKKQDEGTQVKPSMCDEGTISSIRNSLISKRHQTDASTSPVQFNDDDFSADVYCTNLDFTTKRRHVPGLFEIRSPQASHPSISVDSNLSENCKIPISFKSSESSRTSSEECTADKHPSIPVTIIRTPEKHNRIIRQIVENVEKKYENNVQNKYGNNVQNKYEVVKNYRDMKKRPYSGPIHIYKQFSKEVVMPGFSPSKPILARNKEELVHETLEDLRQSIRQHPRDTYRVERDNRKRANSWASEFPCSRRSVDQHRERHVRAKLIPVWNSVEARDYFARVEDYINEKAAKTIKRSYSSNYLTRGLRSRVRWVRIPGETIRIEEKRIIDEENRNNQIKQNSMSAECRELPYELRYWNILHLLNTERATGRQYGRIFPYPLEEWILSTNFKNGTQQTAQEILSPNYNIKSSEDNALVWFLTYDENAKRVTKKYVNALMKEQVKPKMINPPRIVPKSNQTSRHVEKIIRYQKLPDRIVPIYETDFNKSMSSTSINQTMNQRTQNSLNAQYPQTIPRLIRFQPRQPVNLNRPRVNNVYRDQNYQMQYAVRRPPTRNI